MISKIIQTTAGMRGSFNITVNGEILYKARQSPSNVHMPLELENKFPIILTKADETPIFNTQYSVIENLLEERIPFKFLLTGSQKFDKYSIIQDENYVGAIYSQREKIVENRKYHLEFNEKLLIIQEFGIGASKALVVSRDNIQIAQITKPLKTINGLDEYFLHLLDGYEMYFEVLTFFTVYYDHIQHGEYQGVMRGNAKKTSYSVEYSRNLDGYDEHFIEKNFGIDETLKLQQHISNVHDWLKPDMIKKFILGVFIVVFLSILCIFSLVFIIIS